MKESFEFQGYQLPIPLIGGGIDDSEVISCRHIKCTVNQGGTSL